MWFYLLFIILGIALFGLLYFGFSRGEKIFLTASLVLAVILMGLSLYVAFKELRLTPSPPKDVKPFAEDSWEDSPPNSGFPSGQKEDSSSPSFPPPKKNKKAPRNPIHGGSDHSSSQNPPRSSSSPNSLTRLLPKSYEEFQSFLSTPKRDQMLWSCIAAKSPYAFQALKVIAERNLSHFQDRLYQYYKKERKKPNPDRYFMIQILRTLWRIAPASLTEADHKWLNSQGVKLK
ncbi:MAG: hypothetical protein D6785_06390 [Planctomycetota bacterium]|nr:MAG: hypothetical protein D6785_06390 [Planctomycetota bacterium]